MLCNKTQDTVFNKEPEKNICNKKYLQQKIFAITDILNETEISSMIELPEAYVLSEQINKELKGKVIKHVIVNQTPHRFALFSTDTDKYEEILKGKTITGADVHSGSVRITAEDTHLIITTPIRYHKGKDTLPKKHQLYMEFEDFTSVTCTVQMWGCMLVIKEEDGYVIPPNYVVTDKPSPLEKTFHYQYFQALINSEAKTALSVKALLAAGQRLPGVGNGALQDILFIAGIHPRKKISTLTESEQKSLFTAIKQVLTDMREKGGRDTEHDLYGNPGGYQTILSKNTISKPCPVCSGRIKKENYLGGSIYFCDTCQII